MENAFFAAVLNGLLIVLAVAAFTQIQVLL
jgi:hypothetical protein